MRMKPQRAGSRHTTGVGRRGSEEETAIPLVKRDGSARQGGEKKRGRLSDCGRRSDQLKLSGGSQERLM